MNELVKHFEQNARGVNAMVFKTTSINQSVEYILGVMKENDLNRIALVGLDDGFQKAIQAGAQQVVSGQLRNTIGLCAAVTSAQYGIANSGTLIIYSSDEDMRLATMLPDFHFVVLKEKDIVKEVASIEADLCALFESGVYTMFISGPSRTADIERILALGAHGPAQLHIIIEIQ